MDRLTAAGGPSPAHSAPPHLILGSSPRMTVGEKRFTIRENRQGSELSAIFHAGISGARGRMGRAVSTVLDAREDVVVAARFDRGEIPDLSLCDVIIDFSTPDASVELART